MRIISVVFAVAASLAMTAWCGYIFYVEYGWLMFAPLSATLLALPVSGFFHETGHMCFGAVAGLRAVPRFSLFGSSSCKIIPKTDKRLKSKMIFTAFGGLVFNASLVALGICAICLAAVPVWLSVFAPSSLYLFILNALPVYLPDGKTDGLLICELMSDCDEAKVMLAVLAVQSRLLNGKKLTEEDGKMLFALPQIREDDAAFIALTELRVKYFESTGDDVKAKIYSDRLKDLEKYL